MEGRICFLQSLHNGYGAHPAAVQWVPGELPSILKQPGRETSQNAGREVKMGTAYSCTPRTDATVFSFINCGHEQLKFTVAFYSQPRDTADSSGSGKHIIPNHHPHHLVQTCSTPALNSTCTGGYAGQALRSRLRIRNTRSYTFSTNSNVTFRRGA